MRRTVRASELNAGYLDAFPAIKILSLDCFDTIFWRKVAAPVDIFFELADRPAYKAFGLTAAIRIRAEQSARRRAKIRRQVTEISLAEIYREALPAASSAEILRLVDAELGVESEYGFTFQPVVDLIGSAKARGLSVIVVSDTYFSESQLKKLLFSISPDLERDIDDVYCSSSFGQSKAEGIWRFILPKLGVQPAEILHLGDNLNADLLGAERFGINGSHLVHHDPQVVDMFEDRRRVAPQLFQRIGEAAPLPSYFHGHFAAAAPNDSDDFRLGYFTLGPILYSFADFILRELRSLSRSCGRSVKLAFLLRDGFLPGKACAELHGSPIGSEINITRFTAIAASLDSEEQVLRHLDANLTPETIPHVMRQLLLPEDLQRKIAALAGRAADPVQEFTRLVRQNRTLQTVIAASRAFRGRLVTHIRQRTGVQPGDTLVFVDLGYSGTAQNHLHRILKEDLDVDLQGRYLISAKAQGGMHDRKGLIDESLVDARTILALTMYIAAFEMLCTQNVPTTIDYQPDGEPVYAKDSIAQHQLDTVNAIQLHCLQFIRDVRSIAPQHRPSPDPVHLAQGTAIDLCRFLYFPTKAELRCLRNFLFDFNLGTNLKMSLFDFDKCREGMRRRGFTYMTSNTSVAERMNYPMELRHLDVSLANLLLGTIRYGYGVSPFKTSYREETVTVLLSTDREVATQAVTAHAMHDGYFALLVPVGRTFHSAIALGRHYRFVQIDSVQIVNLRAIADDPGNDVEVGEYAVYDGMARHGEDIYEVTDDAIIFLRSREYPIESPVCRLIFRPLSARPSTTSKEP